MAERTRTRAFTFTSIPFVGVFLAVAATILLWDVGSDARSPGLVPYPEGYRTWYHVKSMVILPNHPLADPFAGIHHVYANEAAVRGLRSGHYADGAVLVFDLLQARRKDDEAITEGTRKLIGVMVRDRERYAATGGWGFEAFDAGDPDRRLTNDGGHSCFACHRTQAAHVYVFSRLRD